MAAAELSWKQAAAWRLGAHGLIERAPRERWLDVTARICGLHAQVMSSAELTLWARVEGLQPDDVANALWEERTLVKTWAMRGTLHLLPATDYGLWQAALSTYDHYLRPSWLKAFEVSREQLEELLCGVGEALDGRTLTREELAVAVERHTGSPDLGEKLRGSWGPFLKPAAFRGQLCLARARDDTFASRARGAGLASGTSPTLKRHCARSPAATWRPTARPLARTTRAGGAARRPQVPSG